MPWWLRSWIFKCASRSCELTYSANWCYSKRVYCIIVKSNECEFLKSVFNVGVFPDVGWLTPEFVLVYTEWDHICAFLRCRNRWQPHSWNKCYWTSRCIAAIVKKSVTIWYKTKCIQISTLLRCRHWCQCGISMLRMRSRKQRVQCSNSKQGHTVSLMRSTWKHAQPISYKCRAAVPAASHMHLAKRQPRQQKLAM